jgi:iron-sulfur cluster assembly protein
LAALGQGAIRANMDTTLTSADLAASPAAPQSQTPDAPARAEASPAGTPSPAVILTAAAVAQVKEVMQQQGFEGYLLTLRVVPAGCSGLGYDLNLVKDAKDGDLTWTQDGVTLCTDALSMKYLAGTQMDWVKTDTAAGFKFSNPNAKSSCGCGTSFSA